MLEEVQFGLLKAFKGIRDELARIADAMENSEVDKKEAAARLEVARRHGFRTAEEYEAAQERTRRDRRDRNERDIDR